MRSNTRGSVEGFTGVISAPACWRLCEGGAAQHHLRRWTIVASPQSVVCPRPVTSDTMTINKDCSQVGTCLTRYVVQGEK